MSNTDNTIRQHMDLEPYDPDVDDKHTRVIEHENDVNVRNEIESIDEETSDKEIEEVKQNIRLAISTGQSAIEEVFEIARQTEQPRAFEVLSALLKTTIEANKDLAEHSYKKKEEIQKKKNGGVTKQQHNQNLILTTSDFLDKLLEKEEE